MDLYNEYSINDEHIKSCINKVYIKFNDDEIVNLSNVSDFRLSINDDVKKDYIDIVNCFYSTIIQNKAMDHIGIKEIYIEERRINIDDLTIEYVYITKFTCKDCFIERFNSFYNWDRCNIRIHVEGYFINE